MGELAGPPFCHRFEDGPDGPVLIKTLGCAHSRNDVLELPAEPPVQVVLVPPDGHVLWLVHLPEEAMTAQAADDLLEALHAEAERAAPGRSTVVALGAGAALELLSDGQLAAAGLQRIPRRRPPVGRRVDTPE